MRTLLVLSMFFATAIPALAAPVLTLSANPETYVPGETIEVTITVTSNVSDDLQAVGFELWMPEGVTVTQFVTRPNSGIIDPQHAEGAWYTLASPLTASVEVAIDAEVAGELVLTGQLFWMDSDDQRVQYGEFVQLMIAEYVAPPRYHSADTNGDYAVNLSELLRLIQLYNMRAYHCAIEGEESEDGYTPGIGDGPCAPHDADANGDWVINLTELLRLIQFYNVGDYYHCPDDITSEDGFCPRV